MSGEEREGTEQESVVEGVFIRREGNVGVDERKQAILFGALGIVCIVFALFWLFLFFGVSLVLSFVRLETHERMIWLTRGFAPGTRACGDGLGPSRVG